MRIIRRSRQYLSVGRGHQWRREHLSAYWAFFATKCQANISFKYLNSTWHDANFAATCIFALPLYVITHFTKDGAFDVDILAMMNRKILLSCFIEFVVQQVAVGPCVTSSAELSCCCIYLIYVVEGALICTGERAASVTVTYSSHS